MIKAIHTIFLLIGIFMSTATSAQTIDNNVNKQVMTQGLSH